MSRITKQIAEITAKQLVKSKKETVASLRKNFKNEVEKLVMKQIPSEVIKFLEKFPNYTKTNDTVEISGNGWNFQKIGLGKCLPSPSGYRIQFCPEPVIAEQLLSKFKEIEDKENTIERLQNDLEKAIFNLRTYKSVEENFPEAFLLLPKIENNSLQINLSDIRNRINN